MDCNNIYESLEKLKDENESIKMAAYMRNKFLFLGVPTPKRRSACKEFYKLEKKKKVIDWEFIDSCWDNTYREMQYVAMDYLIAMQNTLGPVDINKIKKLAQTKQWWDTIDGLDKIIGNIAFIYPEINDILIEWSSGDDIWLRRIAIDHQLMRKDKTNTELLEKILITNFGSDEFFINKAIGWSLRDYSKTNPQWVRDFIEKYRDQMAVISIKEATKYL